MNSNKKVSVPKPIAAIVPAVRGWRAILAPGDEEMPGHPGHVQAFAVDVMAWGLVGPTTAARSAFGMVLGGADWVPLADSTGKEEPLNERRGFLGFAHPGETDQEAVDRIQRPILESAARIEAAVKKDQCEREREKNGMCRHEDETGSACTEPKFHEGNCIFREEL